MQLIMASLLLSLPVLPLVFAAPLAASTPPSRAPFIAQTAPIPDSLSSLVIRDLEQKTRIPRQRLSIYHAQPQTWSDGCLGLPRAGEFCTQAVVQGWKIGVTDGTRLWTYRANTNGSLLRLENLKSPNLLLPTTIATQVREDAARRFGQSPDQVTITTAEPKTWSDACLGLGGLNLLCAEVLTPGWQVVVEGAGQRWVYRSNRSGSQVKLDLAASQVVGRMIQPPEKIPAEQLPPPLTQGAIFRVISSGGISGRTVTTVLLADGRILETRNRTRSNPQTRQIGQASPKNLSQFQQLLSDRRFNRFNLLDYPPPTGAADYITVTLSSPDTTVRYTDLEEFKLSEDLQKILRAWRQLLQPQQ